MENKMTTQNYLMVQNNVVTNLVLWDGDINTWQPPTDATMLVQADTQALVWEPVTVDGKLTDWILVETLGAGQIGFTWNLTTQVLTTNEPKPKVPVQPIATGLQTA
jgi:hypothetical protein